MRLRLPQTKKDLFTLGESLQVGGVSLRRRNPDGKRKSFQEVYGMPFLIAIALSGLNAGKTGPVPVFPFYAPKNVRQTLS